jgi:hypothetical protein
VAHDLRLKEIFIYELVKIAFLQSLTKAGNFLTFAKRHLEVCYLRLATGSFGRQASLPKEVHIKRKPEEGIICIPGEGFFG